MDKVNALMWVAFGLAGAVGLFLFMREFWCWFFKINERAEMQKKILEQLQIISGDYEKESKFQFHKAARSKQTTDREQVIDLTEPV